MPKEPAGAARTESYRRHSIRSIHYNLSYLAQREEHGPDGALLLLHGLPGGAFSWRNIMPELAGERAVYAFDLLSYGASDAPWPADVSIWGQADALAPCLEKLHLSNLILVGHDVGGGVAQVLATRLASARIRAVVLISTTCYAKAFADDWPLPKMHARQEPDAPRHTPLEQLLSDFTATFPTAAAHPQRITSAILDQYLAPWKSESGKENLFQHIRQQLPNYSMSVASDMRRTGKPVLILWGEKDRVLPPSYAERLHRDIPNSQLVMIPDTGHLVLEEAPQAVAHHINDFLAQLS
jgi:pimeloyl-ACP methyl ester carboxylesterase